MGNLPFQRKTSDTSTKPETNNSPCQTEIPHFDFENNDHPLLINTVLEKIFKYSSIADLKNFRLVCKDWNFEAFRLLKKIEWKSPILFETVGRLNSFVKTFGPCPRSILNRNLDCGQILVPSDLEPEIFFRKILPITTCIRGLKVIINIQEKRTFVAHESFQPLAQNLQTFDVRFIQNDNISVTADSVYPPTQLPFLPALTSVKIRMDGYVKYPRTIDGYVTHERKSDYFEKYGRRIVHPEYLRPGRSRPYGFVVFESEHKMLVELIQELVAKSPLLSEIHLILNNSIIHDRFSFRDEDTFQHKPIRILKDLKRNELEKITHLRFTIYDDEGDEDMPHLLKLAKSGLNRLKYICIDYVYIGPGLNHPVEENLLEMLEYQRETLEYFKLKDSSQDSAGDTEIRLPPLLPKLKVIKLSGNFIYDINILDLNTRFPNLHEIDLTGGRRFRSMFNVRIGGPITPCVNVKKLQLDNESSRLGLGFFERQGLSYDCDCERELGQFFPNVTEVKYHLEGRGGSDELGRLALWTMTSLEHLVLKVPLFSSRKMFLAILKPFEFISGGMSGQEINGAHDPANLLARLKRCPNITWLPELKSLKIKQRRRYGHPEARDESGGLGGFRKRQRSLTERLGCNILSNMPDLEHFSSDIHCFSTESIAQLKMKIMEFEPGTSINQKPLFR